MAITEPGYNPLPFASNGQKNFITVAPAAGGAASMTSGFPAITMQPIASGGIPPSGQDMNGILHQLSQHQVWLNSGGMYKFNTAHATAIGGYPKGAVLQTDDELSAYISTVDGNQNNPNSNTTGWRAYGGKVMQDKIEALAQQVSGSGLSGSIVTWPGAVVPTGYLECAGQLVSRTTYDKIFAAIGTLYGSGDGSSTFNLPDLRGVFVRGLDHGRGADAERNLYNAPVGSFQLDAQQNITGDFISLINRPPTGVFTEGEGAGQANVSGSGSVFEHSPIVLDASIQVRTATETRPINIAMMYIIKI
jgi:hypothetical protein